MTRNLLATAAVGLALAAVPATALASDGAIDVQDRCDEATFNPAGIDCHRVDGSGSAVTLNDLFASLVQHQRNDKWTFKGDKVTIRAGQPLNISMTRGGEGHTVTEVASFGLGCVPELNAVVFPGQDPTAFPAICGAPTTFTPGIFGGDLIAPGLDFTKVGLSKGTHRFECMIHPWMRTTVTVK